MVRTDDYTTDVTFPAYFYKEMQPAWLSSVCRFLGFQAPDIASSFALCELGCGAGINLLVSAACHPEANFVGVDFNKDHLNIARMAARDVGLQNIEFVHAGFEEFSRLNTKQFDYVTTHGVWSWIAQDHQSSLLEATRASLKTGGIFYLHYMSHPGSTDLIPIQKVLNVFAQTIPGNSAHRAHTALKLLQQLVRRGSFSDNKSASRHIENLSRIAPTHLAHEFLTDNWSPQHSTDVHTHISDAGFGYLGSADVFNNLDVSVSTPRNIQDIVGITKSPALSETLKDLARNTHQRMDLFQKSPAHLNATDQNRQLDAMSFKLLRAPPTTGPVVFTTPIGQIEGPPETTFLLQEIDRGRKNFSALSELAPFQQQPLQLLQLLQFLMFQGLAHPILPVPLPDNEAPAKLTKWFKHQGINLTVLDDCGTAIGTQS